MNTLTCVYCGMAYPEGTPPHGSQILTDHIKTCEKHPMRELEVKYAKVRAALVALVGSDIPSELSIMAKHIKDFQFMAVEDKDETLAAIQVLIDTQ